jgi:hypothetical protein
MKVRAWQKPGKTFTNINWLALDEGVEVRQAPPQVPGFAPPVHPAAGGFVPPTAPNFGPPPQQQPSNPGPQKAPSWVPPGDDVPF